MTAPQTVADVLDKAATRLEQSEAWTTGKLARRKDGGSTVTTSPAAVCWCLEGAILREAHDARLTYNYPLFNAVRSVLGPVVLHQWNDAPGRTQSEVVAALRAAATSARQGENHVR